MKCDDLIKDTIKQFQCYVTIAEVTENINSLIATDFLYRKDEVISLDVK